MQLLISNNGSIVDKNIEITLYIQKDYIINKNDIPKPNESCISFINEIGFVELFYKNNPNHLVRNYPDYPVFAYPVVAMPSIYTKDIIREEYQKYERTLNEVFCYEYFSDIKYNIIKFNLSRLMHNVNVFIPSSLLFKRELEEFEYEIRSENAPNLIKGTLKML